MPFDGLVINALTKEMHDELLGIKIDKIYQPENDEIIIKFRNTPNNKDLFISVNSNHPYIALSNIKKNNPMSPPMFCMLLRKHLHGGKIVDIKQIDFERIISFSIESYDELGRLSIKNLFVEIMGKHSNIILVDKDTNKIIDSIKRIPISISRQRQLLPGLEYRLPPNQDKINVFNSNFNSFVSKIDNNPENTKIYKLIYKSFQGISPIAAKNICIISKIDYDSPISNLISKDMKSIWNTIKFYSSLMEEGNFNPNIVINSNNQDLIDFSSIDLKLYDNNDYQKRYNNSMSSIVLAFYLEKDKVDRIKQKSSDLKKIINTRLERLYTKLQKQKEELLKAEDAEKYKLYGELILANLHNISKGMNEVEVQNYYKEDMPMIKIPLSIRLNASENSQKYYKKYNKSKNAIIKISEQLTETKLDIEYLENVLTNLENTDDISNIDDIKEELIEENIIKKKRNQVSKKRNTSKPIKYISSDKFIIYAGKNNKQNDKLTLKTASKNDIWLHTKDIPGSHVIIERNGKELPETTLLEAASIAAFHSKAKLSSNVPVDYTLVKYVRKPSGAKPGMVIYDNQRTIYITPDKNKIKELLAQHD